VELHASFHEGRARAFDESPRPAPASTGIGSMGGGVGFWFLAHRSRRAVHLENPLQARERAGRRGSPGFAHATWLAPEPGRERAELHVSGTASTLDDVTVCHGDVVRQCQVALANIAALIGPENLTRHGLPGGWALQDLRRVKVYVKRAEDVPVVTRLCREEFPRRAEVAVFAVDARRSDLLVEIEGIAP
ncbi:reactive intermediate/imine deaminase, partial [Actinosynnema sp. NPDC059797]